jgi:hypothetical protein
MTDHFHEAPGMLLQKDLPDHHDAELVLRAYELRREPVMREARDALTADYWPRNAEEAVAITRADHPLNKAYRQVLGYWEMIYGMAVHGIVHADYLVENCGEGLFLFTRVEPYLAELRAQSSPRSFHNTEWAARETAAGRRMMEALRPRIARMAAARA